MEENGAGDGDRTCRIQLGSEDSCDFYQLPGSKEVYAELHWSQQLNPSEGNYRLAHRNELGLQNEGSPRDVTGKSIQNRTLHVNPDIPLRAQQQTSAWDSRRRRELSAGIRVIHSDQKVFQRLGGKGPVCAALNAAILLRVSGTLLRPEQYPYRRCQITEGRSRLGRSASSLTASL